MIKEKPKKIRGLGNVLNPKLSTDFEQYDCELFNVSDILEESEINVFELISYIKVSNTSELTNALQNASEGDIIRLLYNNYELTQNFTVDGIILTSYWPSMPPVITNTQGTLNISNSIVENIKFGVPSSAGDAIYSNLGNNIIRNCEFKCDGKQWNAGVISINPDNQNGLTEIHDCYFYGDGNSSGYGHCQSAIASTGANIYNILIHHNSFNHPANTRSVLWGGTKGKAVCFFNGNSAPTSLNNVHLYCNEYLGAGDTNVNVSEEQCPD